MNNIYTLLSILTFPIPGKGLKKKKKKKKMKKKERKKRRRRRKNYVFVHACIYLRFGFAGRGPRAQVPIKVFFFFLMDIHKEFSSIKWMKINHVFFSFFGEISPFGASL